MKKFYLRWGSLLASLVFTVCAAVSAFAQAPGNITLSVNMSNYVGSFTTVKVNGGFNSWGPAYSLTDPDLDNVWTATVPFPGGFSDYRFEVDPPFAAESMTGACASFGNRGLNVNGNATVPTVYWNMCGVPVTLSVDMTNYAGSFTTVKVNGGFNSWGSAYSLTNSGGNIWTATVPMPIGNQDYRFEADPPFAAENIIGACGSGGNRTLNVTGATSVPTVCWNTCTVCKAPVTLQVDMSQYGGSFTSVAVNGGFNSWGPAISLTDPDLDQIYTATVQMPYGNQDYRFEVSGPFAAESVTGGCASGGNRVINVTGSATVPVVCWNSCSACPGALPGNIGLSVDMSQYVGTFTSVSVNGPFNSWGPSIPLTNMGGGIWANSSVPFPAGSSDYRFEVGGPFAAENVTGGCASFGSRAITVNGNATVPTVCWNSCSACPAVGGNISLSLDMRSYMGTFSTVKVNGGFNSWGAAISLNDPDLDNIWTATVYMPPGNQDYRFEIGPPFAAENVVGACASGGNRVVAVNGNATVPTVCWNSCTACPPTAPVTFRVDMSQQTVSGNGVHIAGNFNGSSFTPLPMTHMGGGVYTKTLHLYRNSTFEYKFLNGNALANAEAVPLTCGTSDGMGGYNRTVAVGLSAKTLPTVCFASCIGCSDVSDWKGITPAFGDAVNWTAGIPPTGCNSNIRITAAGSSPVISSGTFSAGTFAMTSGSTLQIASGAALQVCGNIGASGTISGLGTLVLNGSAAQTLGGSHTITNLSISKPASSGNVAISGNTRIKGVVSFANANASLAVNPGGHLILVSDATVTGAIGSIPSGVTVTGNVTQQRYLPGTGDGWFFLGTGIEANNFSQWSDNMYIAAGTDLGGNQGVIGLGMQHSTIFKYDDAYHNVTTDTAQKRGWRVPTLADALTPGVGFRVWFKSYNTPTRTIDNTGSITQGDFSFPTLHRTDPTTCQPNTSANTIPCDESFRGWNFLANPYPAPLNWDGSGWTKPGIMLNAFYRWNSGGSGYGVYPAGGPYAGAGPAPANANLIAPGQGFFVKLQNAGAYTATLSITEASKATGASTFLRTATAEINQLNISLERPSDNGSYNYLGAIRFRDGASDDRELSNDVPNMAGSRFYFTMPVDGEEMIINTLAPLTETKTVKLNTRFAGETGNFRWSLAGLESFAPGTQIYLKDNLLGSIYSIEDQPEITFEVSAQDVLMADRFELIFSPDGVTGVQPKIQGKGISLYPNPVSGGTLNLLMDKGVTGMVTISIADVLGKTVYDTSLHPSSEKVVLKGVDLSAGVYTVRIDNKGETTTQKLIVR